MTSEWRGLGSPAKGELSDAIHGWALLGVLAIGVGLRLAFMSVPMRYDEAWTFTHYASKPLIEAISNYSTPNNHIFHTLAVRGCYLLLGNHPWVLRLPALVAGILLIPASYLAARALYGPDTALVTAALVASSSPLVAYSTNARGYTLVSLFFLALVVLGDSLARRSRRSHWILFALLGAVGFYTIPIMLYPFGVVTLFLAFGIAHYREPDRRRAATAELLKGLGGALILTLMLYLPILMRGGVRPLVANRFVAPLPFDEFVRSLPASAAGTWAYWHWDTPAYMAPLLLTGFAASAFLHGRHARNRISLALMAALWIIPVLCVQRVVPGARVWLFLAPVYFMTASFGLVRSARALFRPGDGRLARAVVPAVAVLLSAYLAWGVLGSRSITHSRWAMLRDAETIALDVKRGFQADEAVLAVVPSDAPLEYYFNLYRVSPSHLAGDPSRILNAYESRDVRALTPELTASGNLYIVVNTLTGPSLEAVLDGVGLDPSTDSLVPVLVKEYGSSELVRLEGGRRTEVTPVDGEQAHTSGGLVADAGFEENGSTWLDWGASLITATHVHSGSRALRVGADEGGRFQPLSLEPATPYVFEAWAMIGAVGDPGWIGVTVVDGTGTEIKHQCRLASLMYERCVQRFETPPEVARAWVWSWKGPGPSHLYVDDYVLREDVSMRGDRGGPT